MNDLLVEGTAKTPHIKFKADQGSLEISGRSIPENSIEFYQSLYSWIEEYAKQPKAATTVKIQLEYFNTSSSKCVLDVFRKLELLQKSGKSEVTVMWMYEEEDEDMMEAGDDYKAIVKLQFQILKIEA